MSKQKSFVQQARSEMKEFIIKAIDDLLEVLDTPIVYPTNKFGEVVEHRLLAVVKSREQVFISASSLMDMAEIDKSNNTRYKNKIIKGLKTTWHELTAITCRNIGGQSLIEEQEADASGRDLVSDDYMSAVAKSKEVSAKLAMSILDRIAMLENPDEVNTKKLENKKMPSIIEYYVKPRKAIS